MPTNLRLVRASRLLERRVFLKALAIGLSLPLAAKLARIAIAPPTAEPQRFFFLSMSHALPPGNYHPQVNRATDFALEKTNVSILGPLEPYKQYVNVYSGFQYPGEATTH